MDSAQTHITKLGFFKAGQKFSISINFFFLNKAISPPLSPCPQKEDTYDPWPKSCFRWKGGELNLYSGSRKKEKKWTTSVENTNQATSSPHFYCHFLLEENFHPALVILSLSGQIGSAQRAPLLFAVMFETDKSGQTSMEKSQSNECLRRKARVIAGQQHLNIFTSFLLLTQNSGSFFIEESSGVSYHPPEGEIFSSPPQEWWAATTAGRVCQPYCWPQLSKSWDLHKGANLFNPALVPLRTILYLTGLLRVHNPWSEQGPARSLPLGKAQHLYQLPYASLRSQEQSQGITVAGCQNRYLTSATSSIDVQSTRHYVTLNNTSLEDTNSAFTLTPGWTRGSRSVPQALESSKRHWRSSTCNHANQQQNPGLPSHPKAYPQLNHVWPEPLESSMAHRGGTVPPSRLWTRDLSKRKKGVFSFCVSAFLQ